MAEAEAEVTSPPGPMVLAGLAVVARVRRTEPTVLAAVVAVNTGLRLAATAARAS